MKNTSLYMLIIAFGVAGCRQISGVNSSVAMRERSTSILCSCDLCPLCGNDYPSMIRHVLAFGANESVLVSECGSLVRDIPHSVDDVAVLGDRYYAIKIRNIGWQVDPPVYDVYDFVTGNLVVSRASVLFPLTDQSIFADGFIYGDRGSAPAPEWMNKLNPVAGMSGWVSINGIAWLFSRDQEEWGAYDLKTGECVIGNFNSVLPPTNELAVVYDRDQKMGVLNANFEWSIFPGEFQFGDPSGMWTFRSKNGNAWVAARDSVDRYTFSRLYTPWSISTSGYLIAWNGNQYEYFNNVGDKINLSNYTNIRPTKGRNGFSAICIETNNLCILDSSMGLLYEIQNSDEAADFFVCKDLSTVLYSSGGISMYKSSGRKLSIR